MRKEKLDAFTDAVMAIIITLMVLDIKLPKITAETWLDVLRHLGIYGLSFVTIGITWVNYNSFFQYIDQINPRIIWLNLAFLFVLSLVPLPTQSMGVDFFEKGSHVFYGAIFTGVALLYSLLQREANKYITHLSKSEILKINRKSWLATLLYALSIPLSQISIYLSTAIFILLPVLYFMASLQND
jgi:uncharacterized membrane protein